MFHSTNIAHAIKAIEGMKQHEDYAKLKIAYGKDRCGNPPRSMGFNHGQMRGGGRGFNNDADGGVEQYDTANYDGTGDGGDGVEETNVE
ncbi:hypothetical protein BT69DRAFT_1343732 [Atractiella rhizophila]|nr:hypothetical protein BT69DRAFT_1343732 [Atractiella rhizophila]